ncbi:ParA family protein [Lacicoccus alkaliphilus]|uniref:Sporulation initiation inhibitor protein Soj n=1 Tax=Lacicoccus alkaliphilus DSM 16010 TaxID=1123231 RepID=A0A1M7GHE7_9BACL|nr:AAA family ATPase [Salinicoccus alkaliphilus]SHM15289.1 chromosome partitioning protein [Salinicoccus alkaliphilus DSM 16010]
MKIFAIANQKGGVGKTTTAVNLSAALTERGKKVLLADIDPQGNATSGLGIGKNDLEQSIYDVLMDEADINDVRCATTNMNLDLIPANISLAGAEIELVSAMSRELRLKKAFEKLDQDYDYCIIDCPPSLSLLTINAFTAADSVIIPVQAEYYALEGLSQLIDTIELVRRHLNTDLEIEGILLTMLDARTNLGAQVSEEVRDHFGEKVYKTVILRNVRLGEAPSYGQPITVYDPKSQGAENYSRLAEEVIERGR